QLVDPGPSMDYSEDIQTLYRAIARLNKIEKAIILLWLEEKTYQEIAATMGISEKNVGVKLVRIKSKLASWIKDF
nr:sigma-70 family RNA polymerase sigma factor [Saprospiraceae bacterium]